MKIHELVSDELWAAIASLPPPHPAQPRGGRPWLPDRPARCGIIFVLRTGIQWRWLPAERCSSKEVRGVRPIERALAGRDDPEATAMRGYCLAVRSALTDDGRPPLCASGLRLHDRLTAIHASLGRVAERGVPAGTRPTPVTPRPGPRRDRRPLADDPHRLQLGPPGRAPARESRPAAGRDRPRRLPDAARHDDRPAGHARGARASRGPLPPGHCQLRARPLPLLRSRTCRPPTTPWSSISARSATTSAARPGAREPHRGRSCAGRCAASRPSPRAVSPSTTARSPTRSASVARAPPATQTRQEARCAQCHFRQAPDAYLTALEDALCRASLPA